jgi:hypothetical protein
MCEYILVCREDIWVWGAIYPHLKWAYRWVGWVGYMEDTSGLGADQELYGVLDLLRAFIHFLCC